MLTFKKCFVENKADTLLQFSLDTDELSYLSNMDRFFQAGQSLNKPWLGSVDRKRKEFRIMRTGSALFRTGIQINGRVTSDQKEIEIKFKLAWVATVALIWISIFLSIIVFNFFNNAVGWVILVCFSALQVLLLLVDFRKTEEKFLEYIEQIKK
jgi:hypothetical protein